MKTLENCNQRLYYIDLLESIAIFFVVAYHCANYNYNFFPGGEENYKFYFRYFLRTILSCGVPLFFFANGYLLLNRKFDFKKHLKKIVKLTILTFLWGVITLFIFMFIKDEFLSVNHFLHIMWYLQEDWNNHLWFMHTLIFIYLFFPLIKIAYDRKREVFYFFTLIAAILTFGTTALKLSLSIAYQDRLDDYFENLYHLRHIYWHAFVYFCLGGCFYNWKNKLKFLSKIYINIPLILLSMLGLFAVGVNISYIDYHQWDVVWSGYDTLFTLANVICIFFLCVKYLGKNNLLRKLFYLISVNTLGIYFIHVLFMQFFRPYVSDIETIRNIPCNMAYSLGILFLSLSTAVILKKIPVLRRLLA